jgi:hypothetical protein
LRSFHVGDLDLTIGGQFNFPAIFIRSKPWFVHDNAWTSPIVPKTRYFLGVEIQLGRQLKFVEQFRFSGILICNKSLFK